MKQMSKAETGDASDPVCSAVMDLRRPGRLEESILQAWQDAGIQSVRITRTEILQVHYKPYDRARILAYAEIEEIGKLVIRAGQYFFVQVYATPEQAIRRFEKGSQKKSRPCFGPPVFFLKKLSSVGWALPNGPRLGPIGIFFDTRKFLRFLSKLGLTPSSYKSSEAVNPKLIRYVPRKRALFCYERPQNAGKYLYSKIYAPGQDERPASNLAKLTDYADKGMLNFQIPRMVSYSPRRRIVTMEGLPGTQLTKLMERSSNPDVFTRVGRALAGLHHSRMDLSQIWTSKKEISKLQKAMEDIRTALPHLSNALDEVLTQVIYQEEQFQFGGNSVIHGNLFGDQILVESDNVGIVDWDDLSRGDPLFDLGRLMAHVIFLEKRISRDNLQGSRYIECLINGYTQSDVSLIAWNRLSWHVAVSLLLRAKISALRALCPGWVEDVTMAIHEAGLVLGGRSQWIPR